ncbi:MAG TPA: glycosyltransferase [Flavisolibacter sp.]|nr:glycosyltransferase [Flavisolibacter sp.]
MRERKKILWLVSWYPNKYDPFDGDFIQRHARAAALYDDIHVLFIKQAEAQKEVGKTWSGEGGLTEQLIYLPKEKGLLGKWRNYQAWWAFYKAQAGLIVQREKPHCVHVHIPWRVGLVALWLEKKSRVPFVVTEHWGIYNRVVDDNIYRRSFLFRYLLRKIYRKARSFVTVSRFLGEGVNRALVQMPFTVIPNVVDTALFFPEEEKATRFTFIHVSNMVKVKNVEGILAAFREFLVRSGADAQLVLVGNRDDQYVQLAREEGLLDTSVFFRGEIPYEEVAKEMQRAHVFVLNSDMENSPCVIGEALCCGLPVIATNVGGIPELLSAESGILVPPRNEAALAEAMITIYAAFNRYNRQQIACAAQQRFSVPAVGEIHHRLYQ